MSPDGIGTPSRLGHTLVQANFKRLLKISAVRYMKSYLIRLEQHLCIQHDIQLTQSQQNPELQHRPIIFIAHSFGGIVVEKVRGRPASESRLISEHRQFSEGPIVMRTSTWQRQLQA